MLSAESCSSEAEMRIILASKSPRRIEILENLGLSPEILPADVDENIDSVTDIPEKAVTLLAQRKATEAKRLSGDENALVIAADTLVYLDKELLGKPKDKEDAKNMLHRLSGKSHSVYTGICAVLGEKCETKAVETKVFFKQLSESEIEWYADDGEPLDKAGAYGIQGKGSLFVEKICGDYFNVVGLPVSELFSMINEKFGMPFERLK